MPLQDPAWSPERTRDVAFLARLFHRRWAVPALARLAEQGGGRVVELAHRLHASRGGVREALNALTELGLVGRNEGHGHPLRPEYLLTARGERIGAEAQRIISLAGRWSMHGLAFRKWPMPVVFTLNEQGARFSELRARIPGITDRALSDALRMLATSRLAKRIVHPGRPPGVEYLPTRRAGELLAPLRRLAEAA